MKSCFPPLLRNQNTSKRSLITDKYTYCLSIICENHLCQDLVWFSVIANVRKPLKVTKKKSKLRVQLLHVQNK